MGNLSGGQHLRMPGQAGRAGGRGITDRVGVSKLDGVEVMGVAGHQEGVPPIGGSSDGGNIVLDIPQVCAADQYILHKYPLWAQNLWPKTHLVKLALLPRSMTATPESFPGSS